MADQKEERCTPLLVQASEAGRLLDDVKIIPCIEFIVQPPLQRLVTKLRGTKSCCRCTPLDAAQGQGLLTSTSVVRSMGPPQICPSRTVDRALMRHCSMARPSELAMRGSHTACCPIHAAARWASAGACSDILGGQRGLWRFTCMLCSAKQAHEHQHM